MKICVIGAGYVGLVSGACFADRGHEVVCVDTDPGKVAAINAGRSPIHEAGLTDILRRTAGTRLKAQTDLAEAMSQADLVMVAVGTPFRDGRIDLSQVLAAGAQIGAVLADLDRFVTVVIKSTVIPGTTDGVFREALERHSGKSAGAGFGLGMNPEFLTEGTAVADFTQPDRIVIGGNDPRSLRSLRSLYASWTDVPVIECNTRTAEMIKYTSNAVLATMISFSNEIARLCDAVGGVDVVEVMNGVHHAAYFTTRRSDGPVRAAITSFLGAGCGFGGSCLPKDVSALVSQGREQGLDMTLLDGVLQVNRRQPELMLELAARHFDSLQGRRVCVLGLAFKQDTDDVRESPAWPLLRALKQAGARLIAYDPVAQPWDREELLGVERPDTLEQAVRDAEIIMVVTRWREFEDLPKLLTRLDRHPLVVDGRRLLQPNQFRRYEGIGRRVGNVSRRPTGAARSTN